MYKQQGVYTISASDVAKADACQYIAKSTLEELDNRISVIPFDDPQLDMLKHLGLQFERRYLLSKIQEGKSVGIIRIGGAAQGNLIPGADVYQNVEDALAARPDIIYQAELRKQIAPDKILLGRIDFLELDPNGVYMVVDTKLSNETKAGSVLQIAMYSELIEHYTGQRPEYMAIQKYDDTRDLFRCDDFRSKYEKSKRRLFDAIDQYEIDARTHVGVDRIYDDVPEPNSHCVTCKYKATCQEKREEDRSLSLIANIRQSHKDAFEENGVVTIDEVAGFSEQTLDAQIGTRPLRHIERMKELIKQASLQVATEQNQINQNTEVAMEYKPASPLEGLNALPMPSKDDVFLDFEKDKFSVEDGLIYLTGYIHHGNYTRLWSRNQDEERRNFYTLIEFLKEVTGWTPGYSFIDLSPMEDPDNSGLKRVACNITYNGPRIYAYSHAEKTNLRHLSEKYGEKEFIDFLVKAKVIIDLRNVLINTMYLGLRGYGLKEIEKYMTHRTGFRRNIPLDIAVKSRINIEIALAKKESIDALTYQDQQTQQDVSVMDQVEGYNEDDCRSLIVLRDILNEDFDSLSQTLGLSRPTFEIMQANTNYVDPRQRQPRYDQQLLNDLLEAFEPTQLNPTNEMHEMLHGCLEFFKKESMPDWFKIMNLEEEDYYVLKRNDAVLAYYVGEPIIDTVTKRVTLKYERQECDFVGGQFSAFGRDNFIKGKLISVQDVPNDPDLIEVILELSSDENIQDILINSMPSIIMEEAEYFNTDEKMSRLLNILHEYKQIHIDQATPNSLQFTVAHKLLSKMDTEFTCPNIRALTQNCTTASDILNVKAQYMDESILAVQGPPGTGKSYCIKKLVKHLIEQNPNVKIAITANGHAILHSLVESIIRELINENVSASIVQKVAQTFAIQTGQAEQTIPTSDGIHNVEFHRIKDTNDEPSRDELPNITIGTTFFIGKEQYTQAFDYVIVEEAGQLSLVDTLVVSGSGKNMIMVGDQNQLKSPIKRKSHKGAEISGLEYFIPERTVPEEKGVFIGTTRRMHPDVCGFVSTLFYESRLGSFMGLDLRKIISNHPDSMFIGSGLRHVPVNHLSRRSSSAEEEVEKMRIILKQILDPQYSYQFEDEVGSRPVKAKDVMIITPFNNQRKLIRAMLQELQDEALLTLPNGQDIIDRLNIIAQFKEDPGMSRRTNVYRNTLAQYEAEYQDIVNQYEDYLYTLIIPGTVDSYQGKEAPIVLYSTVCSDIESAPRGMDFIFSPNRFNVSVSRAKALFIMIGNTALFDATCKTPDEMRLANAFCYFEEVAETINI